MAVAAGDSWVWFGLLLILLFSGLIAYVGDTIGRRIGRKRLSFLGMRPRNTAIFFTVITGMLIACLAIGTILLVSEGARQRILHFTETVTRLQAQATEQQQQRERAEALARVARSQKSQAERQLVVAGEALVTARQRFNAAEGSRRQAEQRARVAGQAAAETRRRVAQAQRDLVAARQRRDEALRRLSQADHRLRTAEAALRSAEQQERAVATRLEAAQRRLRELNNEIQSSLREIDSGFRIAEQHRRAAEAADDQRQAAEDRLRQAQSQLVEAQGQLNTLKASYQEMVERNQRLLEEARLAVRGEPVVRYRNELARSRFGRSLHPEAIEDQLGTLIRQVERRAAELGAGPDSEHGGQHAVLLGPAETGFREAPDFLRAFTLDLLSHSGNALWVRAIALSHTVRGQPVYYTLVWDPDLVVFDQGEVIARREIDGSEGEAAIARSLQAMIQDQVNVRAKEEGLLPNPDERYTVIGPETWLPVLRRIHEAGRPVTVEVVAAEEIRSGSPLAVAFRVEGQGD